MLQVKIDCKLNFDEHVKTICSKHCVKSVQIQSVFWSVFNPNPGKYGPEKTPYLDTSCTKANNKQRELAKLTPCVNVNKESTDKLFFHCIV